MEPFVQGKLARVSPTKKGPALAGPFPIPEILTDDTPWDMSDSNGGPTDRK